MFSYDEIVNLNFVKLVTNWLTDWLIDWLIDGLIEWLIDWLIHPFIHLIQWPPVINHGSFQLLTNDTEKQTGKSDGIHSKNAV